MRHKTQLDLAIIVVVAVVSLLPFLDKAFHVDDYSYLRSARQIVENPLKPYDFQINWRGTYEPAWKMMNKPPLVPYYLALGIRLFGESERALHATFLIFPAIAGVALYFIARRYVNSPIWPALMFVVCPASLVSSTNVMLDGPSLSLYLTAIALFLSAVDRRSESFFILSGIVAGMACLANYVCLSLLPLLAAYLMLCQHDLRSRLWYLLIPFTMFALWCLHGWYWHGEIGILTAAGLHAGGADQAYLYPSLIALMTFIGGCVFPLTVLAPFYVRRWGQLAFAVGSSALVGLVLLFFGRSLTANRIPISAVGVLFGMLFSFGASTVAYEIVRHVVSHYNAGRALLSIWFGGIAMFLVFINWTVAARFILFLAPPALLVAVHALDIHIKSRRYAHGISVVAVVLSLTLSLALAQSDTRWANEQRTKTTEISLMITDRLHNVFFNCHWGLQYYFEKIGFRAFDMTEVAFRSGDYLITALTSAGMPVPDVLHSHLKVIKEFRYEAGLSFQLQNALSSAGFYSHAYGPLPFTISSKHQETYYLMRLVGSRQQ